MVLISVLIAGDHEEDSVSSKAAGSIVQHLRSNAGVAAQLLDARDLAVAIAGSDGIVVVTAGLHDDSALLLNDALDSISPAWNRSTIAAVSCGSDDAQRPGETSVTLQMAQISRFVRVPIATLRIDTRRGVAYRRVAGLRESALQMIDDLLWWVAAEQAPPLQR